MAVDKFDLNYRGGALQGYEGMWIAPGMSGYEAAPVPEGKRSTIPEAIADAGKALVCWLNDQQVRIDEQFNVTQAGVAIGNAEAFVKELKAAAECKPGGMAELTQEEYDRRTGKS